MKAIVIDIMNNEAALLKEDGSIIKVADHGFQLGQEVSLEAVSDTEKTLTDNKKVFSGSRRFRRRTFAAAIAAALLATVSICAYAMPYGTVTQGNASIQYTINVFDRVIGVQANDEAGKAALQEAGNMKNKKIDEALNKTISAGTGIIVETGNETHDRKLTQELNRKIGHSADEPESPLQEPPADRTVPEAEHGASAPEKTGSGNSEPALEKPSASDPGKQSVYGSERPPVSDPGKSSVDAPEKSINTDDAETKTAPALDDSHRPAAEPGEMKDRPVKTESDTEAPAEPRSVTEKDASQLKDTGNSDAASAAGSDTGSEKAGADEPAEAENHGNDRPPMSEDENGGRPGEQTAPESPASHDDPGAPQDGPDSDHGELGQQNH